MKRSPRPRAALLGVVLLAVTSASEAAAGDGHGPLGVTVVAGPTAGTARVGALFDADGRGGAGGTAGGSSGAHFCTASVVRSPERDLIVTAAHCLAGQHALLFVPGYRDGKAPYGAWKVERDFLPGGWAHGRDEDSDVAFAVVGETGGQGGRRVEDVVGGNRFTTRTDVGATAVTVTGYPDSRDTPLTCTGRPRPDGRNQQRVDCPGLGGGTSGSPWVNGFGEVVGVLGGHEEGGVTDDISYSVVLGAEAAALYREAASGP
ncbi:trypsin-like serine peptidase [Streptomyces phaeoluteigriseus]